jgi:UDP-sugar pyrophosphorylase
MRLLIAAASWLLWSTASSAFAGTSMHRGGASSSTSSPAFFRGGGAGDSSLSADSSASTRLSLSASSTSTGTTTTASSTVSAENLKLLSARGRAAIERLVEFDKDQQHQTHVYSDWPDAGIEDDQKRKLAEQLADLDASYPGGLASYLSKAKLLLKDSADGVNPFSEFTAVVPEGEVLSYENDKNDSSSSSMDFMEAEEHGLAGMADTVLVLVAGGLGERLGYSGIKLSLETNLCTNKSYLEVYIRYVQAMQHQAKVHTGRNDIKIPLVIMTSGDTDQATRELLKEHDNFGLEPDQVRIVTQEKVAALKDSNAGLALEDGDRWTVQTKPHGHGDVHHLLLREGLVDEWEAQGKKHVIFLQDTNALVINSVVPTLGVSIAKGFHMNSICIPRLAGEAAGAIARLE